MATNGNAKNCSNFDCIICDYHTSKNSNYIKHLMTAKHKIYEKTSNFSTKAYTCDYCFKIYKDRTGLWKHNKKCKIKPIEQQIQATNYENQEGNNNIIVEQTPLIPPTIDINLIMEVIKQNQEFKEMLFEQCKQNHDLQKQMLDIAKNTGNTTISNSNNNSNNKQFNLQFFLNETCKDAMNITEFINSLQIQLDDLEYTGDNGYVAGVSKIFLQELNQLDVCKRPIHCSDAKREIFHIKNNENQWEKERVLLIKMIKQITTQNIILLTTWREAHPGCEGYYHKLNDRYLKITGEALGSADDAVELRNFNKIIANVAKATLIDKQHF